MDFDKIEEDYLKVEFILKKQFYGIGYRRFKERYGLIPDIIGECILDPQYAIREIEAMALLNHLYTELLEEFSEQIKDIPPEDFDLWVQNQLKI